MARQERTARRTKRAVVRAEAIITQATDKVSAGTDLASRVRSLRDGEGMAWWRIAHVLMLPGSADNVAQGKSGAAYARKLYASTNGGSLPPTSPRRRTTAAAKPSGPGATGTKTERKLAIVAGEHVIPTDMSDEEVVAWLKGRTIEWGINLATLCGHGEDHWLNQEARVHPEDVIIDEYPDSNGGRVVRFREYLGIDDRGQHMAGPTRTVRLSAIHTVR